MYSVGILHTGVQSADQVTHVCGDSGQWTAKYRDNLNEHVGILMWKPRGTKGFCVLLMWMILLACSETHNKLWAIVGTSPDPGKYQVCRAKHVVRGVLSADNTI